MIAFRMAEIARDLNHLITDFLRLIGELRLSPVTSTGNAGPPHRMRRTVRPMLLTFRPVSVPNEFLGCRTSGPFVLDFIGSQQIPLQSTLRPARFNDAQIGKERKPFLNLSQVNKGPVPVTWVTEIARTLGMNPPLFWPRERIETQKEQVIEKSTKKRYPRHIHKNHRRNS
jgi:hypothetical protein